MSASYALQETFKRIDCQKWDVKIVDVLHETNPIGNFLYNNVYNFLLTKNLVWNALAVRLAYKFDISNSKLFSYISFPHLKNIFEMEIPVIIILTSPCVTRCVTSALKKFKGRMPKKVFTVVTDHGEGLTPGWANNEVDACFVSTDEVKKELIRYGLKEEKVKVIGIPVSPQCLEDKLSKENITKKLGVNANDFNILVMGGRAGTKNTLPVVETLLKMPENFGLIVTCGKNKRLKEKVEKVVRKEEIRLNARVSGKNTIVLGYVDDIYPFMRSSDLIITKAGGLTISEAVAMDIPLVLDIYPRVMEHERGNVKYVKSKGIGEIAFNLSEIPTLVRTFINNREHRENLHVNLEKAKDIVAPFGIVNAMIRSYMSP